MGYRSKLGRVPKYERERFMDKTYDEAEHILETQCPYDNIKDVGALYRPYFHQQLIELGKYCQFDIQPEGFYDFDIYEECESEFHIMTKEMLAQIIREYHQKVQENYDLMVRALEDPDSIEIWERRESDPLTFLKRRAREWNLEQNEAYLNNDHPIEMYPYYLNKEHNMRDGFIAQSWQYEYQIFNLTYIYSSFDWENDYLIYSAW